MGLFYSNEFKSELIGYADAGYLSDPHKARSQTGYLFIIKKFRPRRFNENAGTNRVIFVPFL